MASILGRLSPYALARNLRGFLNDIGGSGVGEAAARLGGAFRAGGLTRGAGVGGLGADGRMDGASGDRMDCSSGGGGCGPAPSWSGGLDGASLDRQSIDYLCREQLMRTVVNGIVDDAMTVRPKLSGETGELTPCIEWLTGKGFFPPAQQGMTFGRRYGGAGTLCFIDDGRPPEEEVDLAGIRDVIGFASLPKWHIVPADAGSVRVRDAWYGPRYGRPEHYIVSPEVGSSELTGVAPERVGNLSLRAGQRWHRSRVIPWQYCDELSLRQARLLPHWSGWGPGVVESCASAYLARRSGALRVDTIMRSLVFNSLTMPDVAAAQSTPDGGSALRNALEWVKWCLAFTSDAGLPLVALDGTSKLEAHSHTVSGIDNLLAAQRQFLLDSLPEYTEVRLFGASQTGMAGDGLVGQWRAYYGNVDSFLHSWFWTCGTFGGGLKQAVALSMLCPNGPTRGVYDPTVQATWPSLWKDSEGERAKTRKSDAEARALDSVTLGLTPDAWLRHDPTVQEMLPSLDVDDIPLPQPNPSIGESNALQPTGASSAAGAAGPGQGSSPAVTPATAIKAIGEADSAGSTDDSGHESGADGQADESDAGPPAAPPPPAVMPKDLHSVADIALAMGMTKAAVAKVIAAAGIQPFVKVPPGTRGGDRYELGKVLAAWASRTEQRADAFARR